MFVLATLALLTGCKEEPTDEDALALPSGPTAALAELSDGDCPDMSGTSTFSSGGLERTVRIVAPDDAEGPMPVFFTFHGLTNAGTNPIDIMVDGYDLHELLEQKPTLERALTQRHSVPVHHLPRR